MPTSIIVTSSDANCYEWAAELIDCIQSYSELAQYGVGILDAGMTETQKEEMRRRGVLIARARWEFPTLRPADMREGYLTIVSRPFIPKYFPGYNSYVHLESDVWIQQPSAISELIAASASEDVAIIPHIHVLYPHHYTPTSPHRLTNLAMWKALFDDESVAFANCAIFNLGALAARANSGLWSIWQQCTAHAAARFPEMGPKFVTATGENNVLYHHTDEVAMNYAIYTGKVSVAIFPPLYNWFCPFASPLYDPRIGKLVEPTMPKAPIKIVHLSGSGKETTQVSDVFGNVHQRGLRWSDWRTLP